MDEYLAMEELEEYCYSGGLLIIEKAGVDYIVAPISIINGKLNYMLLGKTYSLGIEDGQYKFKREVYE